MAASFTLTSVRLADRSGLWDLTVTDGYVQAITVAGAYLSPHPQVDGRHRLLVPGFVDIHVHLDKAFQLTSLERAHGSAGSLEQAIESTALLRQSLDLAVIEHNADRALRMMVAGGTVAARVHVEITGASDPAAVGMHLGLAERHPEIVLELTAFAQHGTTSDATIVRRMEQAMSAGCRVVAGCPYADPEPLRHLDQVIDLARSWDAPIDLHLDLSDRPEDLLIEEVAPRIERAGLQGRAAVGHMTTLTALAPERVRELAAVIRGAGIAVVAMPTTDLFLSGRAQDVAPTRGVTRIQELVDAGVSVALASNNHENAFTPVAMPSLTHAGWLASLTNYMSTSARQLALLDAITTVPRSLLTGPVPGIALGDVVGGALFDVESPVDLIRSAARPTDLVSAAHGVTSATTTRAENAHVG
ncbi:amidohydrolase family protein [Cellulomonas sp. S1-8]|uniref:amidohydrolase family protein n=1 Tax=Cellulomonas sp. S1-8 TaxID=2904790 RepID=UPI0022442111|nr:amidohydrolase family protein [Cellulomonas sp. S1-8]UZN04160.1 amidohydrolase family protein [Cellulomonas sp. S1-8]